MYYHNYNPHLIKQAISEIAIIAIIKVIEAIAILSQISLNLDFSIIFILKR